MSDTLSNDGLLKTGSLLTSVLMGLLAVAAVIFIAIIPLLLIEPSAITDSMLPTATASVELAAASAIAALLCGVVLLALAIYFLQILRRIIQSVGDGDPFVAINASRLTNMGWLALAIEVAKLPLIAIVRWMTTQFNPEDVQVDLEFSVTGLLLALVLFILARVFKHGAAMREDLEGTV